MGSFFTQFFAPFFHNPALVAPGLALIASPIIIHLINRLRYRRVRFAAMEFLLQSQQKNRRRVLLEQLLLLLLRILIVALLVLLIGRLVLSSDRLALLGGKQTHHVVLLDDSGSMRDRWAETSAFDEGIKVMTRLVEQGIQRPGTQKFTFVLLSEPEHPVLPPQRDINDTLRTDLQTRLETLECTYGQLDLATGLEAVRNLFGEKESRAYFNNLHVISDFRQGDWENQSAITEAIRALDEDGVSVNLVKTVPEQNANLAVTDLSGELQVAAAGVPLPLKVKVRNFGNSVERDVGLLVYQDGRKLPFAVRFDKIEAGEEAEKELHPVLDTPARHRIHVSLVDDALLADNTRHLAVDLSQSNQVLIIDGDPGGEEAFYVAAALAADPRITGFTPLVETTDYLRKHPLEPFQSIYLVNVGRLLPDAQEALEDYVKAGGGLAWFMGDAVQPQFYNEQLFRTDEEGLVEGLFPVRLGEAFRELPPRDEFNPAPDIAVTPHPVFRAFVGQDNPLVEMVRIGRYRPVAEGWERDDNRRNDGVVTVASLRNNQPLMLEHRYGAGRVMTCLTSAGPLWNNWQANPGYVPTFLELQKYIARDDRTLTRRVVGEPIRLDLRSGDYTSEVEIRKPDEMTVRVQANVVTGGGDSGDEPVMRVDYAATTQPGIYTIRLTRTDQTPEERWVAYNVPLAESELALAATDEMRKWIGADVKNVQVFAPGDESLVSERDADYEVRRFLLFALVGLMLAEQLLAYRLSYHSGRASAAQPEPVAA